MRKIISIFMILIISLILVGCDTKGPVITIKDDMKTTFYLGEELPDFTEYFIVEDTKDGAIEVTNSMLNNNIEAGETGAYTIEISVEDSSGNVATDSLDIQIDYKTKILFKDMFVEKGEEVLIGKGTYRGTYAYVINFNDEIDPSFGTLNYYRAVYFQYADFVSFELYLEHTEGERLIHFKMSADGNLSGGFQKIVDDQTKYIAESENLTIENNQIKDLSFTNYDSELESNLNVYEDYTESLINSMLIIFNDYLQSNNDYDLSDW